MNTAALLPKIKAVIKHTLPEEVRDEAIDIALNIASDDRSTYRALNNNKMLDLFEDFRWHLDPESLMRHVITGDFESVRNLVFKHLEDAATDSVEKRPEVESEADYLDRMAEPTMREVGPTRYP